jgi:hypothetical protein
MWIFAYLALVLRFLRAARVLAVAAVVAAGLYALVDLVRPGHPFAMTRWLELLLEALVVLALAAFHRDAPPVRRRQWLAALPVGTALVAAGLYWPLISQGFGPDGDPLAHVQLALVDWPGVCCLALLGAALVALVRPVPSWSLALAMVAPAVFGLRAFTLLDYMGTLPSSEIVGVLVTGAAEATAVFAVAVPLTVRAARSLRRLELVSPTV